MPIKKLAPTGGSAVELTGDMIAGDLLDGKTGYSNNPDAKITGTMPDNGTVSTDISAKATEVTIAAGKHNGSGKVKIAAAEQAKVIAGNIKDGVTLLGVLGTLAYLDTSDATATADKILSGYTAYVNDVKITGTYEGGVAFNVWGEM